MKLRLHNDPQCHETDVDDQVGGVSEVEEWTTSAAPTGQDRTRMAQSVTSAATTTPARPPIKKVATPVGTRCEPLCHDERDVRAGIEPGERESHALKQHCEDGPDQAGRDRDQPDEPGWSVREQRARLLDADVETGDGDEEPEELPADEQQHCPGNQVGDWMHRWRPCRP